MEVIHIIWIQKKVQLVEVINGAYGVRILITLSSDVKFSSEKIERKMLTDPRNVKNSWTYNVWDIK